MRSDELTIEDLDFTYPEHLVGQEPQEPCRIFYGTESREISRSELYELFKAGDVLVINDTQVEKRRVFSTDGLEFLFLKQIDPLRWEVLFPARAVKDNTSLSLPGELQVTLEARGLPQIVRLSRPISSNYFIEFGELALPPYIQRARGERHNRQMDQHWYQTDWAKKSGSAASPTASLHFKNADIELLKTRGIAVESVTLHIGMGTFLPIKTERLSDHVMHKEWYQIPDVTLAAIEQAKSRQSRVWALGTTVARTLESYAQSGQKTGESDLFIKPGFEWRVVNGLLTNFHQPKSTLLALVAAFHGNLAEVQGAYKVAIENQFRLFSYGDLSVWTRA